MGLRLPQFSFGKDRFHPNAVELTAEVYALDCAAKLSLRDVPLPVPVETWIESPLGLRFGVEDLTRLGADVLGAAFIAEREILVSDALLGNEPRFRFTCAHELGHFVLHGNMSTMFRDTAAEPGGEGTPLHEREADRFAAAFLMPSRHVAELLLVTCRGRGVDPYGLRRWVAEGSVESSTFVRDTVAPVVAERFGVSRAAAAFRIGEVLKSDAGAYVAALRPPFLRRKRP